MNGLLFDENNINKEEGERLIASISVAGNFDLDRWGMLLNTAYRRINNPHAKLIPTRITYSPPATICYFPDGDKVVAMCGKDDVFSKEVGIMVCIMKKLFGSYHDLSELAATGNEQPSKESRQKISPEHIRKMINRIEQIPD